MVHDCRQKRRLQPLVPGHFFAHLHERGPHVETDSLGNPGREGSLRRQALTSHLMTSALHVDALESVHESERDPDGSDSQGIESPEILDEENEVQASSTSRKTTASESPSGGSELSASSISKSWCPLNFVHESDRTLDHLQVTEKTLVRDLVAACPASSPTRCRPRHAPRDRPATC